MIQIRNLTGEALAAALPDVAQLRIEVFRAWPYLYDGDLDYEQAYLAPFLTSPDSLLVGAYDGDRLVGASTGSPMEDHAEDFGRAFEGTGYALEDIFYCAESVLLPDWRGLGVGHKFFDAREAHARKLGRRYVAFASVMRPDDHPERPAHYRPLDPFWRKRGYTPLAGVVADYVWKDLDQAEPTAKPLQVWFREL